MVDYEQMNALAAYGGFPTRYPHYRFGMEYQQLSKSYEYGLHKIYEMVINNDPTYAYLLEGNTMLDQKLVMAHVYGHADFFKNNMYFAHTNRKMIDDMANHATRIRRYQERYGIERVEQFIDACLAIEELIDPARRRSATPSRNERRRTSERRHEDASGPHAGQGLHGPLRQPAGVHASSSARSMQEHRQEAKQLPAAARSGTCWASSCTTRRWRTGSGTCWA